MRRTRASPTSTSPTSWRSAGRCSARRTQEITVDARSYTVLAKALRPPPEKWHGVEDIEIRYRQRYLDLMANEETRDDVPHARGDLAAIRRFLDGRGFIEVETPVLQPEAGGAAAAPFVTHHNALDQDFYLRIALELHLKRLIVGGFERVYETGRIFRNEGIDRTYKPEFTMIETYEAYADYNDVAHMVEDMVCDVAREVIGGTTLQFGEHTIDLTPPWKRITMREALIEHGGMDFEEFRTRETRFGGAGAARISTWIRAGRGASCWTRRCATTSNRT